MNQQEAQQEARAMAERVLGKAVHPEAIERLLDVWPEAAVEVIHSPHRALPRFTVVHVMRDAEAKGTAGHVSRESTCHPEDQFNRRVGIRLAFDRCLREVVRRAEPERVIYGKRKDR